MRVVGQQGGPASNKKARPYKDRAWLTDSSSVEGEKVQFLSTDGYFSSLLDRLRGNVIEGQCVLYHLHFVFMLTSLSDFLYHLEGLAVDFHHQERRCIHRTSLSTNLIQDDDGCADEYTDKNQC